MSLVSVETGAPRALREPMSGPPRICMPTSRNLSRLAFQCGRYEAQDVLADVENVDLITLEPERTFGLKQRWQRRLIFKDISGWVARANPGIRPVRLVRDYDVFLVVCQTYWDLLHVNAIEGWKDRCRTSVCWLDEMYAARLPAYRHWLPSLLARFDHVVLAMNGTVTAMSRALGGACHYVVGAVDMLRFTPYPRPPDRVIDVYSVGRRWEGVHEVLRQRAAGEPFFYVYETGKGGETEIAAPAQHRDLLASMAKRSRYFLVAPGKINVPEETDGQVEVGFRYFEGAAAGAVLIGEAPDCEPFRRMFDWPDVVIPIKPDGSDVMRVMRDLDDDPDRVRAIHRRNAAEALLRHDWVYRWREVLNIAGLAPGPGMDRRIQHLRSLADMARHEGQR